MTDAPEMELQDRVRVNRLLNDMGLALTPENRLSAYQVLLTADVRFAVMELLQYKRAEVHR